MKLKILDLFSGLGGFSLGLERTGHFETIAFCDNEKYSKLILNKHWKGVKIYNDVREISKEKFKEDGIEFPDIITGGFPCQPFSVAGKQKGTSDDRHLWPEMFRIIKAFKPRFVIGENVRGIVNIQDGVVFETVCTDLESEGYEVQPFNIPAAGVGAPHRRERIWIIATHSDYTGDRASEYETNEDRQKINERRQGQSQFESSGYSENVANTKNGRGQPSQSKRWEGTKRGSIDSRGIEGERKNFSGTENVENSRRTLRQGTELREKNEDEVGKENANQHQRSSSSSESNVANAYTRLSNGSFEEVQSGRNTFDTSSEGTTDVANTESSIGHDFYSIARNGEPSLQEIFGDGSSLPRESSWWNVEPNVGRVAHGIPGRVHRLKGLGNSIIPQIAEEIGKAIIKAKEVNEV